MATRARLIIDVTSSRGASTIRYTTKGRYVSFTTAGLTDDLLKQPIITTSTLQAFWLQVLAIVNADILAGG